MNALAKPVADEIQRRLTEAFVPIALEVFDDSEKHRGHGGHREGVETHFTVAITAAFFSGKPRVERQRLVYDQLRDLMDEKAGGTIHALSLTVNAP